MRIRAVVAILAAMLLAAPAWAQQTPHELLQSGWVEKITYACEKTTTGINTLVVHMRYAGHPYHKIRFDFTDRNSGATTQRFATPYPERVLALAVPPGDYRLGIAEMLSATEFTGPRTYRFEMSRIVVPPIRPQSQTAAGRSGCQFDAPAAAIAPILIARPPAPPPPPLVIGFRKTVICEPRPGGPATLRIVLDKPVQFSGYSFEFRNLVTGEKHMEGRGWNDDMAFVVAPGKYDLTVRQIHLGPAAPTTVRLFVPPMTSTGGRGTGCRPDWPPGTAPE